MDKYFYTSYWFLLHLWQIKSVLKSRKVTQYYDQQCIKIFLLSSSSLIITQALTSIPIVGNIKEFLHGELPKSLLESYINFSPKLNMEVMLTQSNFRFFRKLVALYFYYKLQSIICTIQKIFWKFYELLFYNTLMKKSFLQQNHVLSQKWKCLGYILNLHDVTSEKGSVSSSLFSCA